MKATITEHLQVAIVKNDLEQVLACLELTARDKTFSQTVTETLTQAIEKANSTIHLFTNQAEEAHLNNSNATDIAQALRETFYVISHALSSAYQEVKHLTGPTALRCSLETLCNSPAKIEDSALIVD